MQTKLKIVVIALILGFLNLAPAAASSQTSSPSAPICFIKNNGQSDEQVLFFSNTPGYTLFLTKYGEVVANPASSSVVSVTYQGSSPGVAVSGEDLMLAKSNYLFGNDESRWVRNVPMFSTVRYEGVYNGIDLVYLGGDGSLKKEYIVGSGADPSAIRMLYSGQDSLGADETGALIVTTDVGTFSESAPFCYQIVDGKQIVVPGVYVVSDDGVVSFSIGSYDRSMPLVIDPVYNFSTYLGGDQDDRGAGIGMDDAGNVYVAGSTQSTDFPLPNGPVYQQHLAGGWDLFVSKFSPDGSELVYSTYIGGSNTDLAGDLAVDNVSGEVFLTGSTASTNFPSNGPTPVVGKSNFTDAFVTAVDPTGAALSWTTYYGGNKSDEGTGIALDSAGDVVIVGDTSSDNFTSFAMLNTLSGGTDGFVAKFSGASGVYQWGRYLGGTGYDTANGVAVDPGTGAIWVTGMTQSLNFPTVNITFRYANSGGSDAFVTKLNPAGGIVNSTYLGGSGNDAGTGIALDSNGYPYITGYTGSPVSPISLFPIKPFFQAFQTAFGGGQWDAFITKMERNLTALNYSTYLGGSDDEKAYRIDVDANGTAFVTGFTMSTNFPMKCPTQATKGEGFRVPDAFITRMNKTGTGLLYSTYLGGTYYDEGRDIAITDDGLNITVTGYTESINFPIHNAYQDHLAGFPAVRFTDAFVTRILSIPPVANFTAEPERACTPANISFTDESTGTPTSWLWDFGDGNTSTLQNPFHRYVNSGANISKFNVSLSIANCDGMANLTKTEYIWICPTPFANFTANKTIGCTSQNSTILFNVTNTSGGVLTGTELVWNWSFGDGDSQLVDFANRNVTHTYNKTGNFTVSLTYANDCCNNTTTRSNYIDIRAIPVANFFGRPTSGLVPLHVSFTDNSTGRPSNWTWLFGEGQGNSTEQNPEHTYSQAGLYTVNLTACNFCGCNSTGIPDYIHAGVPNLTFAPGTLVVPTNDTTDIELYLERAEDGLSGYDLDVFWGDSAHGEITDVEFPSWAANATNSSLPSYFLNIKAVDLFNEIHPGDTNIELAEFELVGNISTFNSTISFNVTVNELDDDFGNPIFTNNVPATITVVRLLPFPGKTMVPTDPFEDQVYWDVNGNGRIDFNDVITFFQNMQWTRNNQYIPFFDYNGNGLIDFADLILLFHHVPYP